MPIQNLGYAVLNKDGTYLQGELFLRRQEAVDFATQLLHSKCFKELKIVQIYLEEMETVTHGK